MKKKKKCKEGYKKVGDKCVKKDRYEPLHTITSSRNFHLGGGGVGFFSLLAILFIGLKLGNVIDWSWWWVLAPLWIPVAIGIILIIIFVVILRD